MRNLQGSADTELDQSMGRKAARLAAKPHVVGSIALDERLRANSGGGNPVLPPLPDGVVDWRSPAQAPILHDEIWFGGYVRGWNNEAWRVGVALARVQAGGSDITFGGGIIQGHRGVAYPTNQAIGVQQTLGFSTWDGTRNIVFDAAIILPTGLIDTEVRPLSAFEITGQGQSRIVLPNTNIGHDIKDVDTLNALRLLNGTPSWEEGESVETSNPETGEWSEVFWNGTNWIVLTSGRGEKEGAQT